MRQPGLVAIVLGAATLPIRGDERIGRPLLADHGEVRVLRHHSSRPVGHELLAAVRVGVHAHAVQADGFDPPDGVLDEVFGH